MAKQISKSDEKANGGKKVGKKAGGGNKKTGNAKVKSGGSGGAESIGGARGAGDVGGVGGAGGEKLKSVKAKSEGKTELKGIVKADRVKKPRTQQSGKAKWRILRGRGGVKGIWRSLKNRPKNTKIKLHRTFRRSYREDYARELKVPSISYHIFLTFKTIFKNFKIFLPLILIALVMNVIFVGLMSESTYTEFQDILDQTSVEYSEDINAIAKSGLLLISTITTGGLSGEASESSVVFGIMIFLILWLTTIFILRRILAKKTVTLREGLYNAMSPLIPTLLVLLVAIVQCIPIFLLIIAYSAAMQTDFLATPFYALVFFVFAAIMVILSGYLLSSSLIALVAVSAPGLYPMKAVGAASDLMAGRRIRFILRLIAAFLVIVLFWVIVMLPLILLDLWLKTFEWAEGIPFVPICLNFLTCFTCVFIATYLYLYYKWMLSYEEE